MKGMTSTQTMLLCVGQVGNLRGARHLSTPVPLLPPVVGRSGPVQQARTAKHYTADKP